MFVLLCLQKGGVTRQVPVFFPKNQWHHLYKIKFVLVLYSNSYFHLIILCISVSICICIVMSQEECVMSESGVGSAENSESIWHTLTHFETLALWRDLKLLLIRWKSFPTILQIYSFFQIEKYNSLEEDMCDTLSGWHQILEKEKV